MNTENSRDKEITIFTNKLISILGSDRDLISYAETSIFTSNPASNNWLYTDLTGILCYIFNNKEKVRYFYLYDYHTLETLFSFELYFTCSYHLLI